MKFHVLAGREFRLLLLMCVVVCACAGVSTKLSDDAGGASCIWIGTSVISAFVLTVPGRWKIVFGVFGLGTSLAIDIGMGDALSPACWFALASCAEVLITVLPLRHFAARSEVTTHQALCRVAYFGVFLGPLASALIGAPGVSFLEGRPWPEVVRMWFLSEALGSAAGLPVMLFLLTREKRHAEKLRGSVPAILAWSSPLIAVTLGVFWQTRYPIVFLIIPPLVLVLFRFKLAGAVFGTAFVVIVGAAFTAEGCGPFRLFRGDSVLEQVALFHLFGLTLILTCVPVGFSIEERVRFERALKDVNRRLMDLARLDALTSLHNRRGFDEAIELAWSNARECRHDLSLLYLDIDYFKRFNDTYGHQTGDDCLRRVAQALREGVRSTSDCVARYGGEEFVIFLNASTLDAAHATAERISSSVQALNIPHKGSPFGVVTVSIGIASDRPSTGGTPSGLVRLADEALYSAKQNGRNRIETFVPQMVEALELTECPLEQVLTPLA